MHIISKLGVGAAAVALLAACGSSDAAKTTTTIKAASPTTAAAPTTTAATAAPTTTIKASTAAPTTTIKASTTPTTTAGSTSAAGAVDLATMPVGKVLVDDEGRTLYLFTKDTPHQSSTCDGGCATTWPPVLASGTPKAGTGLEATKLTEIKRSDGTEQLAYNGWPLYRYAKDTKAGDDTGQGVGGTWYVVDATGAAIKG